MSARLALYDAHCHYHDEPIASHWGELLGELSAIGVRRAVVNGTHPGDWDAVDALADRHTWVVPAFGVHPWAVHRATGDWKAELRARLDRPHAVVGEIGIDRARDEDQWAQQEDVFVWQLEEAARRSLPACIHNVRADARLLELLQQHDRPARGYLLHACPASAEMTRRYADLGAWFSYSANTLSRDKVRKALRAAPLDRVLIETDAPYMTPEPCVSRYELKDTDGKRANHPANLIVGYERAALALKTDVDSLAERVADNFATLFGVTSSS